MPPLAIDVIALIPFALLFAAVVGLWVHRAVWMSALIAAIVAGYFTGAVVGPAGLWIAILGVAAWAYERLGTAAGARNRWGRTLAGFAFFGMALAMALLLLPGFPRTVLVDAVVLSPGAAPYSISLGFPKVVAGILILGLINRRRVRSARELLDVLRRAAPVFLVTVGAVIALALGLGYVEYQPKWTVLFLVWAPVNLFFTCMAEEAFFRGFVQHGLARVGRHQAWAVNIAIAVSAVGFGLAHFAGGWTYVLLGMVAGLGYAIAYQRTQRIEAAMAVHFGVNAVHFLMF